MTLNEAKLESIKLYLERQNIQLTIQQLTMQGQRIDHRLIELDGIISALTEMEQTDGK